MADIDALKDIPGYKAIMKSVLKSQIQLLIEQLSSNTGEETIILTASVHDGTLSHLGSNTGKGFLDGRDEIKSQFLGYCLKTHHKASTKTTETKSPSPYQRPSPRPRSPPLQPVAAKRPKIHPVSLVPRPAQPAQPEFRPGPQHTTTTTHRQSSVPDAGSNDSSSDFGNIIVKQEGAQDSGGDESRGGEAGFSSATLPSSLQLSHTQTSAGNHGDHGDHGDAHHSDTANRDNDDSGDQSRSPGGIKVEPLNDGEMDLEITGIEMGETSGIAGSENWAQGYGAEGDESFNTSGGDQSGYNAAMMMVSLAGGTATPHTVNKRRGKIMPTFPDTTTGQINLYHNQYGFSCEICAKIFVSEEVLNGHRAVCKRGGVYRCEICDKMFRHGPSLSRHKRVHRQEGLIQ